MTNGEEEKSIHLLKKSWRNISMIISTIVINVNINDNGNNDINERNEKMIYVNG